MDKITKLRSNEIFVFGSNLAGIHGKGAARDALAFGATHGLGFGFSGQTFAIPTKDRKLKTRPREAIAADVAVFLGYAKEMDYLVFLVTPIGCGLAGYSPKEIAPLFKGAPPNVILPEEFMKVLASLEASSP